ncbi:MAG: hypothetical protein AAFZ91_10105 [Pseudomonadota bacterium]
MARDVDEKKKRKALRKLRKAAALAEQGLGPPLSDWEKQFLEEVEARIETYGSAFNDPEKGGRDEALSALQSIKLREIDKKARGKGKTGFRQRKPLSSQKRSNTRQLDEDSETPDVSPISKQAEPSRPKLVSARDMIRDEQPPPQASTGKPRAETSPPKLRVIKGGADDI